MPAPGFALISVLWLSLIAFLLAAGAWIWLASIRRAGMVREASFRQRLAIEEVVERALRTPSLFGAVEGKGAEALLKSESSGRAYRVRVHPWGLWGLMEVITSSEDERLLARRIVTGKQPAGRGVVLEVAGNALPLVLADAAQVQGVVIVADSVLTRSWRGRRYKGPVPDWNAGVAPLPQADYWSAARRNLRAVLEGEAPAGPAAALLSGPVRLEPQMVEDRDLVLVEGDVRLQGVWPTAAVCVYATGSIALAEGTEFTGQLLSEETISIEGAHVRWPSLLAAFSPGEGSTRTRVELLAGSRVSGTICVGTWGDLPVALLGEVPARVHIDATSEFTGFVLGYGAIRMDGTLIGSARVAETRQVREPATYHNWILEGRWMPLEDATMCPLWPLALGSVGLQSHLVELLP